MSGNDFLHMFNGIDTADCVVDIDARSHSAFATFSVAGRILWSMSIWLDEREIEGFLLRAEKSGAELVLRRLAVLETEPALAAVVAKVCRAGHLTLPA